MKIPDDPFIVELLPEFIDTWIDDLNNLYPSVLESKNTDELYRIGHTIKGSCLHSNNHSMKLKNLLKNN